jgi:two-component system sensor histidine kinase CpxA
MKIRIPLYAKILLWFFLNVVILCVIFYSVARWQFNFGLDALISGPSGERLQALGRWVTAELRDKRPAEWDGVFEEFEKQYPVDFHLIHLNGNQFEQLAGKPVTLPPEVRERMFERRGPGPGVLGGRRGGPGQLRGQPMGQPPGDDEPPGGDPDFQPPQGRAGGGGGRRGQPPRMMIHTSMPSVYWVILPITPDMMGQQRPPSQLPIPLPAAIVLSSKTLSAGGLFFNATPWVVGGLAVIVISALVWFPLVRGITRSVSQMTTATERIAEGRFDVRTQERRQDELGSLSDAIDRMAMRLEGFVSGQKRFLGDIAHELCSPIARMQVALGILEQRLGDKQKTGLDDLREEVEEMSNLVNELLSFSRASLGKTSPRLQPVLIKGVVERAVARESGSDGGDVKVSVPDDVRAMAEPELLLRAISNILRNALRYAAQAGPITISAARENDRVLITVDDCGPGIPEAALAQVFDPFYRVDTSRTRETGGTGLGLSIVKTCIESCGGAVSCENRQPSGLRVILQLPAS